MLSLFDLNLRFTLATEIAPYRTGETSMFMFLSDNFRPGQLIIAYRAFDDPWIFRLIESRGCDCVIRLAKGAFKEEKIFRESGLNEAWFNLKFEKTSKRRYRDLELDEKPVPVRLCITELPNGETEVLCTSILDPKRVSLVDIESLYRKRWGAEEQFKRQKCRVEIENFTGKSKLTTLQDIRRILTNNLMLMLAHQTQHAIDIRNQDSKYKYGVCWAKAIGFLKRILQGQSSLPKMNQTF